MVAMKVKASRFPLSSLRDDVTWSTPGIFSHVSTRVSESQIADGGASLRALCVKVWLGTGAT